MRFFSPLHLTADIVSRVEGKHFPGTATLARSADILGDAGSGKRQHYAASVRNSSPFCRGVAARGEKRALGAARWDARPLEKHVVR